MQQITFCNNSYSNKVLTCKELIKVREYNKFLIRGANQKLKKFNQLKSIFSYFFFNKYVNFLQNVSCSYTKMHCKFFF